MQCEVKEEVQVRRQEMAEVEVQCFRCWKMGYYKWECQILILKRKRRGEEVRKQCI